MIDIWKDVEYIKPCLRDIADGYEFEMFIVHENDDTERLLVRVENPAYTPDDGSDPYNTFYVTTY